MRIFFLGCCLIFGCIAGAQPLLKNTDFPRTIAVLPARVNLILLRNEHKKISDEQIKNTARSMAFIMQAEIYQWFLKKEGKYHYDISLQDIKISNEQLFAAGLSYEDYQKIPTDSLARILHVDAVVFCNSEIKKVLTDAEAAGINALSLAGTILLPINPIPTVGTTTAKFDVGISDQSSPQNLWPMAELPLLFRPGSMDIMLEKTLKLNARSFPYRQKK